MNVTGKLTDVTEQKLVMGQHTVMLIRVNRSQKLAGSNIRVLSERECRLYDMCTAEALNSTCLQLLPLFSLVNKGWDGAVF